MRPPPRRSALLFVDLAVLGGRCGQADLPSEDPRCPTRLQLCDREERPVDNAQTDERQIWDIRVKDMLVEIDRVAYRFDDGFVQEGKAQGVAGAADDCVYLRTRAVFEDHLRAFYLGNICVDGHPTGCDLEQQFRTDGEP